MPRMHRAKLSQIKSSRMSWLGLSGAVSCCTLVLVFGLILFPSLSQTTYAAPEPGAGGVTPSTGTSVSIELPASIDFDSVTPTPDGATTTATADLTVTTTNSASYSLYLYSSDGDNSLRPKISANTSSIIATAGGVGLTLSSLEPNTWGYNLGTSVPDDDTTYSAIPTDNSTPIQTKDTSSTNSANDTYTLSFGAKVDTSIPSGAYSNTLTIAVVAEPAMVTVAFNGNGATSGSMSSIKIPAGGSQALPSNTFTRDSYVFNGWNTTSNGSGTSYLVPISPNPAPYKAALFPGYPYPYHLSCGIWLLTRRQFRLLWYHRPFRHKVHLFFPTLSFLFSSCKKVMVDLLRVGIVKYIYTIPARVLGCIGSLSVLKERAVSRYFLCFLNPDILERAALPLCNLFQRLATIEPPPDSIGFLRL